MNMIKSTIFGLSMALFAVAMVVSTPVALAQFEDFGSVGNCCSTDFGSSYIAPNDYGSSYIAPNDYGSSYIAPSYSSPYLQSGSYYSTPYASSAYSSNFAPQRASTFAPYSNSTFSPYSNVVRDNGNSCTFRGSCSTTTSVHDNNNTIDSYNSCVQPGSCSTTTHDSHNTTISSPTTIVSNNPPASQTQIIYNNPAPQPIRYTYTSPTPAPYVVAPTCVINVTQNSYGQTSLLTWSSTNAISGYIQNVGSVAPAGSTVVQPVQGGRYSATFTSQNGQTISCSAIATTHITYNTPRSAVPYVTLSQVPYTGLELGPFGLVMYWSFLILACLLMAYFIVVQRVHLKVASTLKSVIFGQDEGSAPDEPEVIPTPVATYATPTPVSLDVIDDFIVAQIRRA